MSRHTRTPEDQAAYWTQWLNADRSPSELPLFTPRPPAPSYYRESISDRLDASEVQALNATLRTVDAPLYVGLLSGFCALTSRYANNPEVLVGVVAGATEHRASNPLPFDVDVEGTLTPSQLIERVARKLAEVAANSDYAADQIAARRNATAPAYRLMFRSEGLASVLADANADTDPGSHGAECDVVLTASADGDGVELRLEYDGDLFDQDTVQLVLAAYRRALQTLSNGSATVADIALLSDEEQQRILQEWNRTAIDYPRDLCIHQLIERQVLATPDAPAVAFCSEQLTYAQLNERANRLAHFLIERGVGPDSIVGLWLERGLDLIVSVLAVHKAGGAYVPMDPHYPRDRVTHMAVDSGTQLVLTDSSATADLNAPNAKVLRLDDLRADLAQRPTSNPSAAVAPHHLAYVIYTSGSTGKPKGVMVEHRNAVNFFTGMDKPLDSKPGVWLAVTSLSFDISVLELLWTLTRGFKVVIFSASQQRDPEGATASASQASGGRAMDFDIFYFASDEGAGQTPGRERYRLFIEGAKFGDRHGFKGVWSPERHFDTFGGLYPSPAVQSGALAMITDRIQIRSGSVVLPLHDNVRVAEELQLVDNLSNGRVGVAFTTGWQPDDFVLAPHAYQARTDVTYDGIKLIHALWKGEATTRKNGVGKDFSFRTLPRPVQPELPTWLTCGGGIHGFIKAGELGLNVLTHLLGQTIEELAEKLAAYRDARRKAGHAGDGYVSLMLHTFISDNAEIVKPTVHGPLKNYLKGSQQLFAGFAKELGIDMNNLTEADRETLAEHSFRRYYDTSGLFGTPETCKPLIEKLMAIGVGSIACLIDFGIDTDVVLNNLPHLNRLRESCQNIHVGGGDALLANENDAPYSIQGLIARHNVTHLQCTPSMCFMLLADPAAKAALGRVNNLMIGGEAFPTRLASQLRELNASSKITNMYGPTETTIWSSTHPVEPNTGEIPIGKPIANTGLYVLDAQKRPVPAGVIGELYIGGDGVARGYLNRAELTSERFVADPFVNRPGARMYRTGDMARFRKDGVVEFFGRGDNQIKFRGFRIEMGEIETAILAVPEVSEAVAMVREDVPGDQRLVAYLVAKKGQTIDLAALRERLKTSLTDFMVPTSYVVLATMPLTPNAKVDRKALPAPDATNEVATSGPYVEPSSQLEEKIAEVWKQVLKLERVGVNDNFFDLGGHSVLVVQVLNTLRAQGHTLAMTDLFQYPTISTLAAHINPDAERVTGAKTGADRAAARKARMARR